MQHGYILAVFAVAVSTLVFLPGRGDFAKGQWALLYLLIVVLVAGASGTGPAMLAAVLAFFAWNFFFLPPYHTLVVHDPKDWLSLVAFLAVGVIMGIQTGRMRERESRALAREHEAALLNRLSARLVSETAADTMAEVVLGEVVETLGAASATMFVRDDGALKRLCVRPSCEPDAGVTAGEVETILAAERPGAGPDAVALDAGTSVCLPLRTRAGVSGALVVEARAGGGPYNDAERRLLVSLANLVAVFIERQRLQAAATQAEALRQADRLKSSLVSSVSHELKTPLAALTATVSNLLESDVAWDERSVRDELRAIVTDIARLNNSIGALLDVSRLEARAWEPQREPYELADILAASVDALAVHQRPLVTVSLPEELPLIDVDFVQWVRVLQNLLENAFLYGGGEGPVMVGAEPVAGGLRIWVEDRGPGIAGDEHEAVFEKFYRGKHTQARAPSGTGLGLAIAREIVRAHGGTIVAEDATPGGARFVVFLPVEKVEEVAG